MSLITRVHRRGLLGTLVVALVAAVASTGILVAPTAQGAGTASIIGTLTNTNTLGPSSVAAYDMNWNLVAKAEGNDGPFAVNGLAAGSYYVAFDVAKPASVGTAVWSTDRAAALYYVQGANPGVAALEYLDSFTPVTVAAGQQIDLGTLSLTRGSSIEGAVICRDGTLAIDPYAYARAPKGDYIARRRQSTGNRFQVVGLNPVAYDVMVFACGLWVYSGNTLNVNKVVAVKAPMPPGQLTLSGLNLRTARLFTDVSAYTMFVEDIQWLVNMGITTGYGDGSYRPLGSVNRDAMAAFLYRMAEANYTGSRSCFKDVPATSQFAKEICWLKSTGITTGYGDGTFRPLQPVARDAMAAYMYRYAMWAKKPGVVTGLSTQRFVDVRPGRQFFKEINWMAANRISTGYADGTYRPLDSVHRDAMAAFLSRLDYYVLYPPAAAAAQSLQPVPPALARAFR